VVWAGGWEERGNPNQELSMGKVARAHHRLAWIIDGSSHSDQAYPTPSKGIEKSGNL
jgi:hypothetical protein